MMSRHTSARPVRSGLRPCASPKSAQMARPTGRVARAASGSTRRSARGGRSAAPSRLPSTGARHEAGALPEVSMKTLMLLVLLSSPAWALSFGTGCADANGQEVLVRGCAATCTIFVKNDEAADEPVLVREARYVVHHADRDEIVAAANTPLRLLAGDEGLFSAAITADASDGDTLTMTAIGELDFE